MRKLFPVTIGLLAVAAGGAAVYFTQRPLHALSSRPRIAESLPAGALVLLSVPDPGKTAADWKTTDLYKIWTEPEVQAFLEKPLSKIPPNPDLVAALAQAARLEPKNLFIALTSLDEKNNHPHLLAGFQFKGASKDVETLLAKPRDWLRQSNPAGKADLVNYQGRAIESFETPDGDLLAAVFLDDWYLIGNDLALLKATVDHLDRRAPANAATLDQDADFQTVCAKLPSDCATLVFTRAQPFVGRIFALAAASGQPIPAESRAQVEKVQAIGATTRIEDGKIRDTLYTLAPGTTPGSLQLTSLPLTSVDTLLYAAATLKLPAHFAIPSLAGTPAAPVAAALDQWSGALAAQGVTLENLRAALGDEAAGQIEWPANSSQPGLIASFNLRDRLGAQKVLDGMIAVPLDGPTWQKSAADGGVFYTLTLPNVMFISPTLTLTDQHLIVGLSGTDVHAAAARERATGGAALAQTSGYKAASAGVTKPNVAFAYVDARTFFERVYGVVKPAAAMGAALFAPQISEYVDLGKLPAAETIAKHLSPTVFSESSDAQGTTVESVGTVTLAQALIGLSGGIGAAATPMLQQQYGLVPPAAPSPGQKTPTR